MASVQDEPPQHADQAIMLFPLVLFVVGLFSIDQYRTTLIMSEFTLERQGFTLARSLALAQSEIDGGLAAAAALRHEPPVAACRLWNRAAGAGLRHDGGFWRTLRGPATAVVGQGFAGEAHGPETVLGLFSGNDAPRRRYDR